MTLNDFFYSCEEKNSHLFRQFIWILVAKFKASQVKLISGEHKLSGLEQRVLLEWVGCRKKEYPLEYFMGSAEFMGEKFLVSSKVFIPRTETEQICKWVIKNSKNKVIKSLLDIGSGSGCLGIGAALFLPTLEKLMLIEPFGDESLSKNVEALCSHRLFKTEILKKSFENCELHEKFDLILSNPPYIYFNDPDLAKGVYKYEPSKALFGGVFGWEKVIHWAKRSYDWLSDDGLLVFEISHDQRNIVEKKLEKYKPQVHKDDFGKDRFFVIHRA